MRRTIAAILLSAVITCAYSQTPDFIEPSFSSPAEGWEKVAGPVVSWGSIDMKYSREEVPETKVSRSLAIKGWRGERVNAQALIWTPYALDSLRFEISDLKYKGYTIPSENIEAGFVRYVLADVHNPNGDHNCALGHYSLRDSLITPDAIDTRYSQISIEGRSTRPIWLSCKIPAEDKPGLYRGRMKIHNGKTLLGTLNLEVIAGERILPEPSEWAFHLDLWQNPYSVARYHDVPLWSEAHLEAMRPLMTRLAQAGQKVITATITHKPWNGQTLDHFDSMVTWFRDIDGNWEFRYEIFDRWVEFMMSCGITDQISCFSTVSWSNRFQYYDQATASIKYLDMTPGTEEYDEIWGIMLKDFAGHLKEKGWFDICTIAMDERPLDLMQKTIRVIREADKDFKISLAGRYHPEIDNDIHDYCIVIGDEYPNGVIESRRLQGKVTTIYNCCTPKYPNSFLCSDPSESVWPGLYAAKLDVDGFLRWALNSWPEDPLYDGRFGPFGSGDTFYLYPFNISCIRFERLLEGIQAYEKIRILKNEYLETGNVKSMHKLHSALESLDLNELPMGNSDKSVNAVKAILD